MNGTTQASERTPLLQQPNGGQEQPDDAKPTVIDWEKDDPENPRNWTYRRKMTNVAVISIMAIVSPLGSSMFTPGIEDIADSFGSTLDEIIAVSTGYVITMGIGPLILAPMSETFGRRSIYLICFSIFTLIQIPTAVAPNPETLIACRTVAGFFGSVSIANGGGTLNDMFVPSQRAQIFGWYLLGPLLGPTIGPLLGGVINEYLNWRWIFAILTILCAVNTALGFLFLKETFAPTLLKKRCNEYAKKYGGRFTFPDEDRRPLLRKIFTSVQRPLKILFTQPIVLTMAFYQAIIFATLYSLYTNMQAMFGDSSYDFNTLQIGLMHVPLGLGFLAAVWFVIPRIDTVYNKMTERNNGEAKPEFRLPLANIGSVLLPTTLIWFGWTVHYEVHWAATIFPLFFYGIGQIATFNTVQNYYIDSFSRYAASAIAAGTVFRSVVGGLVPLFAPKLFRDFGYGWGWTTFALITLLLSPSPLIFMKIGPSLRKKFAIEL